MDLQWNTDGTVSVTPPKRPKKMTGTRFASVLGLNRWNTAFQQWCEITKAYNQPFEDTKYTLAGKAIEPRQIEYMRESYGMDNLIDPHDVWGEDPFGKTYGNFYNHPVFGGMWDALLVDADTWDRSAEGLVGSTDAVLEFKTTKRAEDWEDGVPEYYALQAALYAWLLDCDNVIMVVSFLEEGDYEDPGAYVPSATNTATREFSISERYPNFIGDYIDPALAWWNAHVETGNSPAFDEKADADYLKEMRKASLNPDTDIAKVAEEYVSLCDQIAEHDAVVATERKRADELKKQLRQYAMEQSGDRPEYTFEHGRLVCKLVKSFSEKADEKAMKADGIWEKYAKQTETARFTPKVNEEN